MLDKIGELLKSGVLKIPPKSQLNSWYQAVSIWGAIERGQAVGLRIDGEWISIADLIGWHPERN